MSSGNLSPLRPRCGPAAAAAAAAATLVRAVELRVAALRVVPMLARPCWWAPRPPTRCSPRLAGRRRAGGHHGRAAARAAGLGPARPAGRAARRRPVRGAGSADPARHRRGRADPPRRRLIAAASRRRRSCGADTAWRCLASCHAWTRADRPMREPDRCPVVTGAPSYVHLAVRELARAATGAERRAEEPAVERQHGKQHDLAGDRAERHAADHVEESPRRARLGSSLLLRRRQ